MQKYTLTLYIAAPGTPKTKGAPSISGHVYYSISDGEKSQGWGFAPTGFPYVSAPGIVEDDEFNIYQNPYYKRTMEITKEQYKALKAFGKNPEQYGFNKDWYAAFSNSCVDFTYSALRHAKIYDKKIFGLINDEGAVKVLDNRKAFDSIPNQIIDSPLNTPPDKRTHPMPKQEWYHKLISENEQDTQHDLAANIDISKPLAKNASAEEFCEYGFAALLSDDDDKMHAALDSLLASDIGRSTMQEAAALYERQEQEKIARLEQMQHDAPAMRMTRG
jgi:hypothetical protein